MKNSIVLFLILLSSLTYAQNKDICSVIETQWDTIVCENSEIISEVTVCENHKIKKSGISYFDTGKEYLYFEYKYDNNGTLKKIIFWTFHYINSGYVTDYKFAVIEYNAKGESKLISKNKNKIDIIFAKLLAQIKV